MNIAVKLRKNSLKRNIPHDRRALPSGRDKVIDVIDNDLGRIDEARETRLSAH